MVHIKTPYHMQIITKNIARISYKDIINKDKALTGKSLMLNDKDSCGMDFLNLNKMPIYVECLTLTEINVENRSTGHGSQKCHMIAM